MKLDTNISFIGKCILIEDDFSVANAGRSLRGTVRMKILAFGDVHLGFGDTSAGLLSGIIFRETLENLEKIIQKIEKVDIVVILGDVKHYFGGILDQEWREARKFFELLKKFCRRIVVVKGNHDTILEPFSMEFGLELKDYLIFGKYGFFHGHKMFDDLLGKNTSLLICGHLHPAITLRDSVKSEKYKCFLVGKWKGRKVIVVPSFFPLVEGGDVFYYEGNLGFSFDVEKAEVYIVGNDEVLYFEKLRKIQT